jgi:acetylornithine deacetylase/succinyl-diaminopimelate desuccinylase-like protein
MSPPCAGTGAPSPNESRSRRERSFDGGPIEYARAQRETTLARLVEFLRIPSVSTLPDHAAHVRAAAEWVAVRLAAAGADEVRIDETPGHPVVFGRCARVAGAPTVLVYGHYDVQPADPLGLWTTPPFEPTERGGGLYARGASDDKGQVLIHLEALAAWQAAAGGPPVNLVFVIEGEEEVGSPNLGPWLRAHRPELRADVAVVSDTAVIARGQPSVVYGLRGLAYMEVEVDGPTRDLHSGQFGGAVKNPASALAQIIAALHDADGRVMIPGFYDRVRSLSDSERTDLARLPFDHEGFAAAAGQAGGWGERGYTIVERLGARPTLDVNGMWSGWTLEGAKTVLPARAAAKISMRLVPDQEPDEIARLFTAHVQRIAPAGVSVTVRAHHGARPVLVDRSTWAVRAAAEGYASAFGVMPVYNLEGGSIPVVAQLKDELGLDTVLMGFGLPDDNLHAPDEKFEIDHLHRGIEAVIAFLAAVARHGAAP